MTLNSAGPPAGSLPSVIGSLAGGLDTSTLAKAAELVAAIAASIIKGVSQPASDGAAQSAPLQPPEALVALLQGGNAGSLAELLSATAATEVAVAFTAPEALKPEAAFQPEAAVPSTSQPEASLVRAASTAVSSTVGELDRAAGLLPFRRRRLQQIFGTALQPQAMPLLSGLLPPEAQELATQVVSQAAALLADVPDALQRRVQGVSIVQSFFD